MPGPAPKKPEERRRRNVPKGGEWVDLPDERYDGSRPKTPPLDTLEAIATWELWWSSPMAFMWTEADWPALLRLIQMIDRGTEKASEIRLQEDRFGLSPGGRKSLRWRIVEVEEESVQRPKAKKDRRSASLEVIAGGG